MVELVDKHNKKQDPKNLSVDVAVSIKRRDIANLLCSAFEGGSNYWLDSQPFKKIKPKEWVPVMDEGDEKPKKWPVYDYPLLEGGAIEFKADPGTGEQQVYRMDLEMIQKGLQLMAKEAPRHFGDFISENGDATTADVFLQLCLFGEIVYG